MIIVCGLAKGTVKEYKCPYCPFESDDIEDFATGMCWECVFPENFGGRISNEDYYEQTHGGDWPEDH